MIIKKHIKKTLIKLNQKYSFSLSSPNPEDATYYAKLATLEYCGWIEESMDSIVKRSIKGKLQTNTFRQILNYSIIENTHGFQYVKHFRPMLMRAIGILKMELLENYLISKRQLEILKNELEAVKIDRDDAAHTWINGVTKSYPAPSLTQNRLEQVFPILKGIYSQVL